MLFSSITFIYYFLPVLLIVYFIVPNKFKNIVLLIASLLFYYVGEPNYIWVLLLAVLINYIAGIIIDKSDGEKNKKIYFIITIILDLSLLLYFKYTDFFIVNVNEIFKSNISLLHIIMPIGISFFTFQTMSYTIDVYKKRVKANYNLIDFATYVCLFPQLVAGPIVRYITIKDELKNRTHSYDMFASGVKRFTIGLAKKVIIANMLGELWQVLLTLASPTVLSYIIRSIAFTLQIYFDFSGYSDMAIGLGLMFGFKFLENFNYPLIASSITDFWRRWHISLSSFLKDYVYIPLGGSRVSKLKFIRNIFIVWFLTGFWHGAAWNFIIWGLFFAVILLIEKKYLIEILSKHKMFGHIYTLFLVVISFVIFNSTTLGEAFSFIKNMLGFGKLPFLNIEILYYLKSYLVIIVVAVIAATPGMSLFIKKLEINKTIKKIIEVLETVYYIFLLILVTAFLIDASFNPFLYFRF